MPWIGSSRPLYGWPRRPSFSRAACNKRLFAARFTPFCTIAKYHASLPKTSILALCALLITALSGCTGIQHVLDPRGPAAEKIAALSWVLFGGGTVIFLLVVGILCYVLWNKRRRPINHQYFIIGGGILLPVVTLSVLLVFVFRIADELTAEPEVTPLRIEVTGHQWWWKFRYIGDNPQADVITANELHIPVGRPVELQLTSADVIHSFWVPNLAGKLDLIPGMTNILRLQADTTGLFRGACNEFCGAQHALMRLYVISEPVEDFQRWFEVQQQPARPPEEELLQRGQAAFLASGCPVCHTVRGTEARGATGPDLTHFGSRRSIAAGTLRNNLGNRQAWIASPQHIKPENNMPEFRLDAEDLRALAHYLGSLE